MEPASSVGVVCCSGQRAESRENSSGPANKSLHMRRQPVTEPMKDAENIFSQKHSASNSLENRQQGLANYSFVAKCFLHLGILIILPIKVP